MLLKTIFKDIFLEKETFATCIYTMYWKLYKLVFMFGECCANDLEANLYKSIVMRLIVQAAKCTHAGDNYIQRYSFQEENFCYMYSEKKRVILT